MIELADNTDSDGLSRIMKAMVVHHEQLDPKVKIARIRLERETSEDENGVSPILSEATVARFEDGGIGIVPKIESRRAVRATNLQRGTP
jgi:peptidyl-tRNA hydrolase